MGAKMFQMQLAMFEVDLQKNEPGRPQLIKHPRSFIRDAALPSLTDSQRPCSSKVCTIIMPTHSTTNGLLGQFCLGHLTDPAFLA